MERVLTFHKDSYLKQYYQLNYNSSIKYNEISITMLSIEYKPRYVKKHMNYSKGCQGLWENDDV